MSNYFPLTSTISAVGTSQLDPITDSPPVFALTRYDNCSGSGTAPTLSLYQNNTPFHSNVPAHSTLDIQVAGGAYSCGIGYQNIDPNSTGRTLITGTTDFSISAWIGGGGSGHIYGQFQGTQPASTSPESKQTFAFYKSPTGLICFKYGNGTGISNGQTFCTTATAATSTWAHVAATKTGQTISLYVNGVGQSFTASTLLDFSIYSGASIGTITNQPITDIGIFQRTLSPTEITQIYSSKAPLIAK